MSAFYKTLRISNNTNSTSVNTGAVVIKGGVGVNKAVHIGTDITAAGSSTTGALITLAATTFTDNLTSASGTLSNWAYSYLGTPTLGAFNSSVTTTAASTLYIQGAPIAGTNETLTNAYALYVASGSSLFGGQIKSTVAPGTAPIVVDSTTVIPNLNASLLNGGSFASPGSIGGSTAGSAAFTTISASGVITSSVSSGTSPLVISSTTNVANLNASSISGNTFASPGAIGTGAPSSGSFTTILASGVVTSIVSTGTAPIVVASTTNVANLNASLLNGATFASPGAIGSTVASSSAFTSVAVKGSSSGTISVLPQAASGTYNFNMPTTAGTSGYGLTSGGGSSAPMIWRPQCFANGFFRFNEALELQTLGSHNCTLSRSSTGVYLVTFTTQPLNVQYVVTFGYQAMGASNQVCMYQNLNQASFEIVYFSGGIATDNTFGISFNCMPYD